AELDAGDVPARQAPAADQLQLVGQVQAHRAIIAFLPDLGLLAHRRRGREAGIGIGAAAEPLEIGTRRESERGESRGVTVLGAVQRTEHDFVIAPEQVDQALDLPVEAVLDVVALVLVGKGELDPAGRLVDQARQIEQLGLLGILHAVIV
ncbi:hypothetical protein QU38_01775, partial [Staphylococcus aureus]